MKKSRILTTILFTLIFNLFLIGKATSEMPQQNPEYPEALWAGADSSNFSLAESRKIDKIILHATGSTYESTKNSFQNPSHKASAHYVIDQDGKIYQLMILLCGHNAMAQDYPSAKFISNTYSDRYKVVPESPPRDIKYIVIHATGASTAQSTINWFTQPY